MKVTYKELLDKLGIDYQMEGYQTQPWLVTDGEKGVTCSAEVRVMDGNCEEIEAEIMLEKAETKPEEPKIEVVLWTQATLGLKGKYSITKCRFEGKDFVNETASWEEKICRFFKACVRELKQGKIPDIAEIKDETMSDKGSGAGQGGRGGGRQPKIKPNQLLNDMKRGGAGF